LYVPFVLTCSRVLNEELDCTTNTSLSCDAATMILTAVNMSKSSFMMILVHMVPYDAYLSLHQTETIITLLSVSQSVTEQFF